MWKTPRTKVVIVYIYDKNEHKWEEGKNRYHHSLSWQRNLKELWGNLAAGLVGPTSNHGSSSQKDSMRFRPELCVDHTVTLGRLGLLCAAGPLKDTGCALWMFESRNSSSRHPTLCFEGWTCEDTCWFSITPLVLVAVLSRVVKFDPWLWSQTPQPRVLSFTLSQFCFSYWLCFILVVQWRQFVIIGWFWTFPQHVITSDCELWTCRISEVYDNEEWDLVCFLPCSHLLFQKLFGEDCLRSQISFHNCLKLL